MFSVCSCSQKPGDSHPCGSGLPGKQPVCEVQQHRAEDGTELEAVGSERGPEGLCAGHFPRLQEHHREASGEGGRKVTSGRVYKVTCSLILQNLLARME